MVDVRRAQQGDAQAIHELLVAAFSSFRNQYTAGCFDATVLDADRVAKRMREGPVWVAVDGASIVGTVGAKIDSRGLYVRGMGVLPSARGQGIGDRLLAVCQRHAERLELPCMWLSTTTFLHASQRLYLRFGFLPSRGPTDLHGTALVSFEKSLQ